MTSPVLVTGGTGRLGRSVVARLVDAGRDVRVLARRQRDTQPQVTFFTGDLRRGEGIDPAVCGVEAIIHCATATKGDAEATRNLVTAAARAGSSHFVQPSIVGIDAMAAWGYVKTKLEVERIVENGGLPWTILRVTQFHNYCFENSRKLAKFPLVAPVPGGFRVQPVDSREVADQSRQRELVSAFFAASRNGDFRGLLMLLDPDVKLRADRAAVAAGAQEGVRGAAAVAEAFAGRARAAQLALIDGRPGAVWAPAGRPRVVFAFTVHRDKITAIDMIADPGHVRGLAPVVGDW